MGNREAIKQPEPLQEGPGPGTTCRPELQETCNKPTQVPSERRVCSALSIPSARGCPLLLHPAHPCSFAFAPALISFPNPLVPLPGPKVVPVHRDHPNGEPQRSSAGARQQAKGPKHQLPSCTLKQLGPSPGHPLHTDNGPRSLRAWYQRPGLGNGPVASGRSAHTRGGRARVSQAIGYSCWCVPLPCTGTRSISCRRCPATANHGCGEGSRAGKQIF